MKLSAAILLVTVSVGSAWAQSPSILQTVKDKINGVQQQKTAASNAALNGAASPKAAASKPAVQPNPAQSIAAKPPAGAAATKPAVSAKVPAGLVASKPATVAAAKSAVAKPAIAKIAPAKIVPAKTVPVKIVVPKPAAKPAVAQAVAPAGAAKADIANAEDSKDENKNDGHFITAGNRRDPFVSPIVQHMAGAGCNTGKRCLAIDQIALRGIVKSDAGMIAVVVNSLDKAYFLRENDPVFNGYVLKISGDTVVFKETVQDRLGHLSTREVVKKITTPAV